METASTGDKEDGQNNLGLDTRKTYESILLRKQARIAKEAAFERRARALTKHFLRAHEEKESHKLDYLHEASQKCYDQSMEKVRDEFSSEAVMREMFREENRQISQLMQERTRQRELEEQKLEEKKADREYYMQARSIHSQLQCEERQRKIEEIQIKRAEEIKDRKGGNKVEAEKDETQEKDEKVKVEVQLSSAAKYDAEFEKVTERRRMMNIQNNKGRQQQLSARAEKEQKALHERQNRVEKMQQDIRTAEEERHRKVQERKQEEEEALFKKVEQMNLKGGSRLPETPRSEPRACSSRLQSIATVHSKIEIAEADMETPQVQDRKVTRLCAPTFDSKEMIESNTSAHKDYVLRVKELDDIAQRMNVNKRYKTLADEAAVLPDDYREARLKAVHQTHMGPKSTATSRKERLEVPRTNASTPSRQCSEDALRTPRQKPRLLVCGLCMKEYPPDRLVGSALRKTVEKMRNQTANMPNNKGERTTVAPVVRQVERSTTKNLALSAEDGFFPAEAAMKSPVKRRSLYDYEVKLCVNCDIFVRITSS